jgi:hypothetical protein
MAARKKDSKKTIPRGISPLARADTLQERAAKAKAAKEKASRRDRPSRPRQPKKETQRPSGPDRMIGEADLRRAKPGVAEEILHREEAARRHAQHLALKKEEAAWRKHMAENPDPDFLGKGYSDHVIKDLRGESRIQKALRDIEREKAARLRRKRVTKGRGKPKFKGKL